MDRHVDSVFQYSWSHYVEFVRDLLKADSVNLGKKILLNTLDSTRKLTLRDYSCNSLTFFESSICVDAYGTDRQRLRTRRTDMSSQLISRIHLIRWIFLDDYRRSLHCSLFLVSEDDFTRKTDDEKRLTFDSLTYPIPITLPISLCHGRYSFKKTSRITARSREVLTLLFSFVVITPLHLTRLRMTSVDRILTFLGTDSRRRLHYFLSCRSYYKSTEVRSPYSRHNPCRRKCRYLDNEASPINAYCNGTDKRKWRIRSVPRKVFSRRRISRRYMDLVNGHELFWRSVIVELSQFLIQASRSCGRRMWFGGSRDRLFVWSSKYLKEILCFSVVIGILDVYICTKSS